MGFSRIAYRNEWSYTEFRYVNGEDVSSRITTSYEGGIRGRDRLGTKLSKMDEFSIEARYQNLAYWISVHNHPPPGLDGPSEEYDIPAMNYFRKYYPEAAFNAYSTDKLYNAYRFFEMNRK